MTTEEIFEDQKFPAGRVLMTCGVEAQFQDRMDKIQACLKRHFSGDWGDLTPPDKKMNDRALETGEDRILSKYEVDPAIYIITEWDRSATTVLLPMEY